VGLSHRGASDAGLTITIDEELDADLTASCARAATPIAPRLFATGRSGLQQAGSRLPHRAVHPALVYVYDHEARELPKRLTATSMTATIWRKRPCTYISTRQLHGVTVLKDAVQTCSLPIASLPSAACATAMWLSARRRRAQHGRGETHSHGHTHNHVMASAAAHHSSATP